MACVIDPKPCVPKFKEAFFEYSIRSLIVLMLLCLFVTKIIGECAILIIGSKFSVTFSSFEALLYPAIDELAKNNV